MMAGRDTADTTKDLKEALRRSRTLQISFPPPYGFRQREGGSKVSDLPGIKHESEDISHGMQHLGELSIKSWRSTEGKTSLLLSSYSLPIIKVISTLSRFCKEVQHLMIDVYSFNVSRQSISKFSPSGMKSVLTVSLSCMAGSLVLEDVLAFSAGCFPYASSLKLRGSLKSSSGSSVTPTLDLEELVLTLGKNQTLSLDNLLNTVSAACRKLKRFHIYSDRKFPLHTLPKMISQLACPELELLKLSQAKISLDKIVALEGVSWQKSSKRCELILDKASAELPLMDVVHVVSRELKGVTVLSLNESDVKFPGKIDVTEQKLREDTSIREINLYNMKDPVPENDMQALFTINVTLRDPSPHDGADMVHKYRSADEKPVEMPPPAKKRAHPSLAAVEPKRVRKLQLDPEGSLDIEQASTSTTAHIHTTEMERTPLGRKTHGIAAGFTEEKEQGKSETSSSSSGNTDRHNQILTEQQIIMLAHLLPFHVYQELCLALGFSISSLHKIQEKHQWNHIAAYEEVLHQWKNKTGGPVELLDKALVSCDVGGLISEYTSLVEPKRVRKLQLDPEGKLDREQTSTLTPARRVLKSAKKREMTSQGTPAPRIPASFTEGIAPMEPKRVRKLELDPEGKLDKEQTSTSATAHMHTTEMERTPRGRQAHAIAASFTLGKALVEPKRVRKLQLDPEGKLEKEQTSTLTPARRVLKCARKREMTSQGTQTIRIPASYTDGKGKPLVKECHEKIGAEGGKIQLDSFGIVLQIPRGAVDTKAPVDIALRVLTDSPTNLDNNKEEVLACFGVQCLAPDDLVLKKPVTFLIPHCAELHRLTSHSICVVMYTGDGEYTEDADAKERILLSDKGMPRCVIEKKLLRLTVDHFSWRFFKFIWRNIGFKGKKLYCIPFVEQNIPEKPEDIILHVYLCDVIKGNIKLIKAEELELGYVPAHTKTEVLIRWAETDLKLQCCVNSSTQTKSLSYDRISGSPRNCVSFVSKYKSKRDIVSLTVGQEGVNPEILFRIDVGDHQIAKQGTSKASSSSSGNTVRQRQAVTDQQIAKLAELLSSNAYSMLCRKLGIKYNFSCQILEKHRGNCKAAYMEVLHQWKDKTGGPIKSLDKALDSCDVGGLISEYKE